MIKEVAHPWLPVADVAPSHLLDARLCAHWAAQLLAAVANDLVPAAPHYGHTALQWVDALGVVASQTVPGPRPFRVALRVSDLSLFVLDASDQPLDTLSLDGHTLADGLAWLTARVEARREAPLQAPLGLVGYTMQSHAVADGAPFASRDRDDLRVLERWFYNGARALEAVRATVDGASDVQIWPHHFDIATLAVLDGTDGNPEEARSLGFGLSPGDETYAEPYWYVLPWPAPKPDRLEPLGVGQWHTEGFVGAVLTGDHDSSTVRRFFEAAERIGRGAIGG